MFKGLRTNIDNEQKAETGSAPTQQAERPAESIKRISNEELVQAWTSYALLLPEQERALADRMKIITPTMSDDGSFTISVDNQLVADMFNKESERIKSGISKYLNGTTPAMKVIVPCVGCPLLPEKEGIPSVAAQ